MIRLILLVGILQLTRNTPMPIELEVRCHVEHEMYVCLGAHGERVKVIFDNPDNQLVISSEDLPPAQASDPVDVPAVEVPEVDLPLSSPTCPSDAYVALKTNAESQSEVYRCHKDAYHTCSDKSRILLHSEDGKYWCHKVQE